MKKYLPYIVLAVFCIPLFFIGIKDAHGLGDDFAQYIKEASNISKGRPYYATNWVFNILDWGYAPPQYPPGFPLLLAPVVKIYGLAIRPMLYMNALIVVALLLTLFAYFRKYTSVTAAVCLSLVIVYSNEILGSKGELLSDVPCLLFVSLYLLFRNRTVLSPGRMLLLLCIAVMVLLIRSQGFLLIMAEGLLLLLSLYRMARAGQLSIASARKIPSLWLAAGSFLLYLLVSRLLFQAPMDTFGFYTRMVQHRESSMIDMVRDNINYLHQILLDLLHFPIGQLGQAFTNTIAYGALIFAALGFVQSLRRQVRVDDIFFLLMCGMIVFTPIHQGPRFFYEAFPVYLLYSYTGLRSVLPGVSGVRPRIAALALTALYLVSGYDTYVKYSHNTCDGCVPGPMTNAIFGYLETHMTDSDIVACPRPRLITLFTDKRAVVYASKATDEENRHEFDSLKVKYMMPWFDNNLRAFMRRNYRLLDSAEVGDAIVYRVR